MDSNRDEKFVFDQPKTFAQRRDLAKILVERLQFRLPLAIDSIDNPTDAAFAAWPERIYILDRGGRVVYKGGMGPFGFLPEEAEKALEKFLG
jgi:type I thyroxine 5'-deiodinase